MAHGDDGECGGGGGVDGDGDDDDADETMGAADAAAAARLLPNGKKTKGLQTVFSFFVVVAHLSSQKSCLGRVKIRMEFIQNKLRRYTTFSKRKTGIMKKAHELSTLTGTQVMLLVASETGHVYAFATHKLRQLIGDEPGKSLIQSCLNAPDGERKFPI